MIPEPEQSEPVLQKPVTTLLIVMLFLGMLSAVQFNHQLFLQTHKINDVWSEHLLPPELAAGHLPSTKSLP